MERDKRERGALQSGRSRSSGCYDWLASEQRAQGGAAQRQAQRGRSIRPTRPTVNELRNFQRVPYSLRTRTTRCYTLDYTSARWLYTSTVLLVIPATSCFPSWKVPPLTGQCRQDTISNTGSGSTTPTTTNAAMCTRCVSYIRHKSESMLAPGRTACVDLNRSYTRPSDARAKSRARASLPPRRSCSGSPTPPINGRLAIGGVLLSIGRNHHSVVKNKKSRRRPTAKQQRPGHRDPSLGRRLKHEFS